MSTANILGFTIALAASTTLSSQYLGAPVATFGYAAIGAVLSYAWGDPETRRFVLLFKVISTTFFSVACAVLLPDLAGWELKPASQPALALVVAMFARWLIPAIRKGLPAMARGMMEVITHAGAGRRGESGYYQDPPRYPNDGDSPNDAPRGRNDENGY